MSGGWRAELDLVYGRVADRTVPLQRRHVGPLRIQKGLTPEGPALWHQILVHPPGGVAGGDQLNISIEAREQAQVLLTTPGATKWYRSSFERAAAQQVRLEVAAGASLEWLPMENIFFNDAHARLTLDVEVAPGAKFIGFELHCLGRTAGSEPYESGVLGLSARITEAGRPIFAERARVDGGGRFQHSVAALAGCTVFGTLFAYASTMDDQVLATVRALKQPGEAATTRIGRLLIHRWRGRQSDEGLRALRSAWAMLRPALLGREARDPRIWST